MNKNLKFLTQAGIIAALYTSITIVLAPLSYGAIQIRVSEALMVLPFFTPAAIPGLFIGCILANLNSPLGIIDIIVGSLATLIAAWITWKIKKKPWVPMPSIVINAIFVPFVLKYALGLPYFPSMLWVALGQAIACYGFGYPLLVLLNKSKIFK
ncbi:QueT transporter family protein [Garciella nitratireducens]|uniref:QueT transporter family protein n=1 Tax=Garciella nitratireducens TaxID=218205 RepID=UPI000DEBBE8F|nr:QueT transporter family protein [Garciella nitratireducens]RBP38967.1 putative membrane protein [Garciella nitratireducens]